MADQMIGNAQDRLGAAEVLAERDDAGLREVALEIEDVADVGAAPAVDRLVGIADDAQVRIIHRQAAGDGVLGLVRVLIFVDEDIAKAGVELGAQLRVVLKGERGPEEQIVEVDARWRRAASFRRPGRPGRRSA